MKTPFIFLALVAAAGIGTASAQPSSLSRDDMRFLHKALQGGRAEVALARDILGRTENPRAVRFAHRMIDDHTQNDAALVALEQSLNVTPASGIADDARNEMRKLERMHGDALAGAYLAYELQDHENDIADFRRELNSTSNRQIREYVRSSLPILRQHRDLARSLTS